MNVSLTPELENFVQAQVFDRIREKSEQRRKKRA
jgi:hypothetical protein